MVLDSVLSCEFHMPVTICICTTTNLNTRKAQVSQTKKISIDAARLLYSMIGMIWNIWWCHMIVVDMLKPAYSRIYLNILDYLQGQQLNELLASQPFKFISVYT